VDDRIDCRYVLDVGMGTGWMTHRLANLFSEAKVVGIDFAFGMLEAAGKKYEGLKMLQADARALPFAANKFDIVISNLAYQWVGDLEKAFQESHRVLTENGTFCITLFGYETLKELFSSFNAVTKEKFEVRRLASSADIEKALHKNGFQKVEVSTEIIKVHFQDMFTLVKWLKDIGANVLPRNQFIGKEAMLEASEFYQNNFSEHLGVVATFEVVWVKAQK
jgi:malonyl-CoA O-methyltransferase